MRRIFSLVPLFSELDDNELDDVIALAATKTVRKKNVILQEGDLGNSLYVILEGSVKISYYAPDGREIILSILNAGEFFGEISLLDSQPRSATVTATEETRLAQIRNKDFNRLLLEKPHLAIKCLEELALRLRRTNKLLERVCTMDVPHRLYNYLRELVKEDSKKAFGNYYLVSLPTHQVIADQLSTSRETISRAIGALKKDGIIKAVDDSKKVAVDIESIDTLLFSLD
ncbi:MAG: Crp/Fnr family transcriptional regulator [Zetaproteobacteria bacterium CG_4_9_14_3_um_filter_49_83]|nr:MAG: Crp/Fnr family transcriptional regulator [Zetaproteobacteria bacterium CG1_02_49_23]PIQ34302.1 MAG: Crp/Fnr family transcriptional regulator [Zetaproteobacteria bacterium CG17_big_fil_post_rev_8_21_14_2_50_50_13]PIV29738.1 MAG: Crp/Fnr family transcriptional regulator [Zetaproteobacteria bacterium CG02_land_8_20_14_3_00_50_9]PIY57212.1 MAG: Crp/Fnr family transcriptional regulator [Zetaproteobacteria bacterium CG_4_10_14_0_8_um_filter_49_80]PJA35423.1 MAG: Crp/Fnr family transcriptional